MEWSYRCIIVPAAQVQLARDLCSTLAAPSGDGMFTTELMLKNGPKKATHYISAGLVSSEFAAMLPLTRVDEETGDLITTPGRPDLVISKLHQMGTEVYLYEIEDLYSKVYVTDTAWQQACDLLGVKIKRSEVEL